MASGAPVPPEARSYQGAAAGLVSRAVAGLLDALVVGTLVIVGLVGLNGVVFVLNPVGFRPVATSWPVVVACSLGLAVTYLTVAWSTTGRSYGCHLMGLRVVDGRDGIPRLWVAFVRAVVCVAFPLGLAWCAVGSSRAAVHDHLVRTRVVYDWLPRTFTAAAHPEPTAPAGPDR